MKTVLFSFLWCCMAAGRVWATVGGCTEIYQPLSLPRDGKIQIQPVVCSFEEPYPLLPLIAARFIPPSNGYFTINDANAASRARIVIRVEGDHFSAAPVVILDCGRFCFPERELQRNLKIVGATLECLRLELCNKPRAVFKIELPKEGAEPLRALFEAFLRHPKEKEFPWEELAKECAAAAKNPRNLSPTHP